MRIDNIKQKAARLSTSTNSEDQRTQILIACINADVLRQNTVTMANAVERLIAKALNRIAK